jgi:hypothetical protein
MREMISFLPVHQRMNQRKTRVHEFLFPDFHFTPKQSGPTTIGHELTQWHYIDKKTFRNVQAK